jgi:L-glutamine-phosphate cytidylyltransferase
MKTNVTKKAIILAAGRGSRLNELTNDKPKALVKVNSLRLIEWQINAIRASGISDILVVGGYRHEDLSSFGLPIIVNRDWCSTNMVFSLFCAKDEIDESVIVSYSDIIYSEETVSRLSQCPDEIAIAFDKNWLQVWSKRFDDPLSDAESFELDNDMNVSDIGRRVNSYENIHGQYMGLLKFTPSAIKNILRITSEKQRRMMDMTQLLSYTIKHNIKVRAIENRGFWFEIDSPRDIVAAETALAMNIEATKHE